MDYLKDSISNIGGGKERSGRAGALWIRVGLLLILLTTGVFQPVDSQEPAPSGPEVLPVWNLKTVDGPRYFTNMTDRALAFKPDGTPCAAYGGDGLYFACLNSTTGVWNSQVIDNSIGVGQYAALAFFTSPTSGKTDAFISYYDAYNGQLKFVYTLNEVWQAPITVPNPPPGTLAPVTNLQDEPVNPEAESASTSERNFADEIIKMELPWLGPTAIENPEFTIESNGVGKHTSIAVDSNGVYISYYDAREVINDPRDWRANIYERNLKVAFWNGGMSWDIDVVDDYSDQGAVGLWSSIKVDYNGNLHVAYMSEKYDTLKYALYRRFNTSWADPVTVDGGYPYHMGSMCSIALYDEKVSGVRGVPYISYLDWTDSSTGAPNGKLKVARLIDLSANRWNLEVVDSDGITGWWTSIVTDMVNEKVYVSYYQAYKNNEVTGDLKLATKRLTTGDWETVTVRAKAGTVGQFSSIALRPSNLRPSFLHYNASRAKLEYTYYKNRTEWGTLDVDTNGSDVGYASSLALSNIGTPHISYLDATFGLGKYALVDSSSAYKSYPLSNFLHGYYSSIQLAWNISPRIASYGTKDGDLIYGKRNGGIWEFEYVDRTFDVGQYVSMALGTDNRPHISYYDATNKDLRYAYMNLAGTDWVTETLDWVGDVGQFTSITMSPDNRVYISYYDAEHEDLRIAYQVPPFSFWQFETVDDGGVLEDNVGWFSSIALDNAGNPHISYYDETNGDLKYAYKSGASWIKETLQSTGDVGLYTSLKIYTPTNTRHLCYLDLTNGALRYAQYSGGVWEYQLVDGDGDVGYSCSLDLTAAGQPAISYYDNSRADLRLALSYTLPPVDSFFLPLISLP